MAESSKRPRPLPRPTPETQHFWDGTKQGELLLQRCRQTGEVIFPPRPFAPGSGNRDIEVFRASGRGTLWSYVINHRQHPSFDSPYCIALVKLEEGPIMLSNIVDCEQTPEALVLDMPLEVTFEDHDDIAIPLFRPAR